MKNEKKIFAEMEVQYFGDDMHEKAEIDNLPKILKGVKVFIDVGGSLGQYTYFAGKFLNNADLYCIEPDSFKVKKLSELAKLWKNNTKNNYHVINKAVSDNNGIIKFYTLSDHSSSGAFFPLKNLKNSSKEWVENEVECITLDSFFNDIDIDLIKIDVEGAEYRVLNGAKKILEKGKTNILMEIAPWGDLQRSYKPSDIFKLMTTYNYSFSIYENHYLFYKRNNKFTVYIKNLFMGFILDNPFLKKLIKKFYFFYRNIIFFKPK